MNEQQSEPTKFDSVFWIEVDKIVPNPYQPRKVFDEERLKALAESIRQYGVLQPLVVTRNEKEKEDGGLTSQYELVSGERRFRASKLIGLREIPAVIRDTEIDDKTKLELAIIENLQREDLNAVDRARAFKQLADEFDLTFKEVGRRVGMSREYVSNSVRILGLPEHMQQALLEGNITEGHTRPLLMVKDYPEKQEALFKDILKRKINVRQTELIAREIAVERVRKQTVSPEIREIQKKIADSLGTRVLVKQKKDGGELVINYFSKEDLEQLARTILGEKTSEEDFQKVAESAEKGIVENAEDPEDLYSITSFSI